jgi:hypothetical protein
MSISPSEGQVKGSNGRSQKAGQIPGAQGRVSTAVRLPRGWDRRWCETRRAEVYFFAGSGWEGCEMARRTRRSFGVLKEEGELVVCRVGRSGLVGVRLEDQAILKVRPASLYVHKHRRVRA